MIHHLEVNLDNNNACNMECKYCFLGENKHAGKRPTFEREKFDKLDLSECCEVIYWGGEPFIYWNEFKEVVSYFRARCPKAFMSVVSNGTIITPDVIDFSKRMSLNIGFSHDGPDQERMRGEDYLKDPRKFELLKQLPYRVVLSQTLSGQVSPYSEWKKWAYDLSERGLNFTCKCIPIRATDDRNLEYGITTQEACDRVTNWMCDLLDDAHSSFRTGVLFAYTLEVVKQNMMSEYPCAARDANFFSTTTDLTQLNCTIGGPKTALHNYGYFACEGCPVAGQCYVSCHAVPTALRDIQCVYAKQYAEAVNTKFDKLFGKDSYFQNLLTFPSAFVCADLLVKAGRKLPVKPRRDCFYYFTLEGPEVEAIKTEMTNNGLLVAQS